MWNTRVQQSISIIIVILAEAGRQIARLDYGELKVREIHNRPGFCLPPTPKAALIYF